MFTVWSKPEVTSTIWWQTGCWEELHLRLTVSLSRRLVNIYVTEQPKILDYIASLLYRQT